MSYDDIKKVLGFDLFSDIENINEEDLIKSYYRRLKELKSDYDSLDPIKKMMRDEEIRKLGDARDFLLAVIKSKPKNEIIDSHINEQEENETAPIIEDELEEKIEVREPKEYDTITAKFLSDKLYSQYVGVLSGVIAQTTIDDIDSYLSSEAERIELKIIGMTENFTDDVNYGKDVESSYNEYRDLIKREISSYIEKACEIEGLDCTTLEENELYLVNGVKVSVEKGIYSVYNKLIMIIAKQELKDAASKTLNDARNTGKAFLDARGISKKEKTGIVFSLLNRFK